MDYKYIEQLIERYFDAETTLQEEQILAAFFAQEQVPESLEAYRPLFAVHSAVRSDERLSDDFDRRVLSLTEGEASATAGARTVTLSRRLSPLFRAVAVVAIMLTLGNAMRYAMESRPRVSDEINYADYTDTFDDPNVAYGQVEDALILMTEGFALAQAADTLAAQTADTPRLAGSDSAQQTN